MFELVTKHKLIAQVILALIMIPFAFFGVDYYFRGRRRRTAPSRPSAGRRSRRASSPSRIREQQEQMRQQLGKNFDPAMFDSPEVRFALLQQLINQHLLTGQGAQGEFPASPTRSCSSSSPRSLPSRRTAGSRPSATGRCC